MSSPYVGEIRMFAGNFAPAGWATCDGQLIAIADNPTLFQLIGTIYGGDGQSTFALPNLSGCVPVHMGTGSDGSSFIIGQNGGSQTVTLTTSQIPSHGHTIQATSSGQQPAPSSTTFPADATPGNAHVYGPTGSAPTQLAAATIGASGGSQPHDNMQPYLAVTFIISLFGVFPTQS